MFPWSFYFMFYSSENLKLNFFLSKTSSRIIEICHIEDGVGNLKIFFEKTWNFRIIHITIYLLSEIGLKYIGPDLETKKVT